MRHIHTYASLTNTPNTYTYFFFLLSLCVGLIWCFCTVPLSLFGQVQVFHSDCRCYCRCHAQHTGKYSCLRTGFVVVVVFVCRDGAHDYLMLLLTWLCAQTKPAQIYFIALHLRWESVPECKLYEHLTLFLLDDVRSLHNYYYYYYY